MQNEAKLSAEKIKSLISMLNQGNSDSIESQIKSNLNENQRQKINSILSDPQKLRDILSSPQAQELMKKFGRNRQGENADGSP
ncbi:MAG: hypothetical protein E7544_03430 [Ruminococcaceae bacterium]|nr:hypothetical protein [Oscillospiraceae bacterium]